MQYNNDNFRYIFSQSPVRLSRETIVKSMCFITLINWMLHRTVSPRGNYCSGKCKLPKTLLFEHKYCIHVLRNVDECKSDFMYSTGIADSWQDNPSHHQVAIRNYFPTLNGKLCACSTWAPTSSILVILQIISGIQLYFTKKTDENKLRMRMRASEIDADWI